MHVAMISHTDPRDPSACSGLLYPAWVQLNRLADRVTLVYPGAASKRSPAARLRTTLSRAVPGSIHDRIRTVRSGSAAAMHPPALRQDPTETALQRAEEIRAQLDAFDGDIIVNCMMSSLLYRIEPEVPFVHFTDATARVVDAFYPAFAGMSREQVEQFDVIELEVLPRAAAIFFLSEVVRQKAIVEYGLDPNLIHVVHPGSNIRLSPSRIQNASALPTQDDLRLIMTASDPKRKRVDYAIDVLEAIRARGWNASLTLIGRATERAVQSPHVKCAGFLKLSSAWDQRRYLRLMSASHVMILPSAAETFGIAPLEMALVGRPSVVSDAFGLPEAVLHDETGVVVPLDATPEEFAEQVILLCSDSNRLVRLGSAAKARVAEELNWDRWGDRVAEILGQILDRRTATAHAAGTGARPTTRTSSAAAQ